MRRIIYYVSHKQCTDVEPRPGWYVGPEMLRDIEGDGTTGPFLSRLEAMEARDEINRELETADELTTYGRRPLP